MALQRSQRLSIAELQIGVAREKIHEIQGINTPKICAEAASALRDKHPGSKRKVDPKAFATKPPQGSPQQQVTKEPLPQDERPKTIKTIVGNKKTTTTKVSLLVPIYDFGYVDNLVGAQKCTL